MMTPEQERECLAYDPFAGDFGDQSDKILSDRMVTAAKDYDQGKCCICAGGIAKGERHRKQVGRIDGEIKNCRMCERCCIAMAQSWQPEDAGDAIELRTELGMRRQGAMGRTPEPKLTEAEFFSQKQRQRRIERDKARDAITDAERIGDVLGDISSPAVAQISWRAVAIGLTIIAVAAFVFRFLAAHHG